MTETEVNDAARRLLTYLKIKYEVNLPESAEEDNPMKVWELFLTMLTAKRIEENSRGK